MLHGSRGSSEMTCRSAHLGDRSPLHNAGYCSPERGLNPLGIAPRASQVSSARSDGALERAHPV
jgi:hypothetical protein